MGKIEAVLKKPIVFSDTFGRKHLLKKNSVVRIIRVPAYCSFMQKNGTMRIMRNEHFIAYKDDKSTDIYKHEFKTID